MFENNLKLIEAPDDIETRECGYCDELINHELLKAEKFSVEFEVPERGDIGDGWKILHLRRDCKNWPGGNQDHAQRLPKEKLAPMGAGLFEPSRGSVGG